MPWLDLIPPDQGKTDWLVQIPRHPRSLRHPRLIDHLFLHFHLGPIDMAATADMVTEEMHDIRNGDGSPRYPVKMGWNAPE
jgi:hypothetical protein